MRHLKQVTAAKAVPKADDFAETAFFQLYFTVLSIMLTAAFSDKG